MLQLHQCREQKVLAVWLEEREIKSLVAGGRMWLIAVEVWRVWRVLAVPQSHRAHREFLAFTCAWWDPAQNHRGRGSTGIIK